MRELKNKVLILCKASYPVYLNDKEESKRHNQEPLSWLTTFFSEEYNEGGLKTIFGFSSLYEGRLKDIQTNLGIQILW